MFWLPSVAALDRDTQTLILAQSTLFDVFRPGMQRMLILDEPVIKPGYILVAQALTVEDFAELVQKAVKVGIKVEAYITDRRIIEALNMFLPVALTPKENSPLFGPREVAVLVRPKKISTDVEPRNLEYTLLYYTLLL